MHSDLLKKFAAELKSAREEKQISLNQIAAKTRIDLKYLTAIENGNFEVQPELYVRAFIKEFAQCVDLNPEETIKKYEMAKSGKVEAPVEPDDEIEPQVEKPRQSTKTHRKHFESEDIEPYTPADETKKVKDIRIIYGVIGAAVVILAVGLYLILGNSSTIEIDSAGKQEQASSEIKRFEQNTPVVNNTPVSGDSLRLNITATDLVWFEITPDNEIPAQYLFKDKQYLNITAAAKFILSIGNAGGVKLTLDGKALDPLGKPGEVKNVQIDKDGVKLITIDRPQNEQNRY